MIGVKKHWKTTRKNKRNHQNNRNHLSSLGKEFNIYINEAYETPGMARRNFSVHHDSLIPKNSAERLVKIVREKNQVTYKGKHIRVTAD